MAHLGCMLTARSASFRDSCARVKGSRPYSACASDCAAGMFRSLWHKLRTVGMHIVSICPGSIWLG